MTDLQYLIQSFRESIPRQPIQSVCEFGRLHVQLVGSARREGFDPDITPWTRTFIECSADGTRTATMVKPVQSGGSAAGEVMVCRRIAMRIGGDIQWNWEDDVKAGKRWEKRLQKILKACGPVSELWPKLNTLDRFKAKKCLVLFPHCNLEVQGQFTSDNLDSDTIAFQINEELHNWKPGHLQKADGRLTAVWNGFQGNISNASFFGDQFHQKFKSGTQQHWEVLCPHCGHHHEMRTEWDDKRPDLGGLRYNADGCRIGDGYDYNKLERTIRFQMPCGGQVPDDRAIRRRMSAGGRDGSPKNPGAKNNRSFTLEAVSVDYIPWMSLIQEKHLALRALHLGDPEPWWKYLRERECRFVNKDEDRPVVNTIQINTKIKKNRGGLPGKVARLFALDRQQGRLAAGEFPHWWLVIRDFEIDGNSLLVWEGKVLTDADAIGILDSHECLRLCGAADTGFDTPHVYQFCLQHGINGIKGDGRPFFHHKDGGRRIFSEEELLCLMANAPRTRDNPAEEPLFWFYSKAGIYQRLHWLRNAAGIRHDAPGDVSEDYKKHNSRIEFVTRRHPRTGENITEIVFHGERYDLAWCEAAIAMLAEMAGLIGSIKPKALQPGQPTPENAHEDYVAFVSNE